jgi:hypothetical protein
MPAKTSSEKQGNRHGGAREGAGRKEGSTKPDKKESITIRLTPEQQAKLKALGGGKWIRQKIDDAWRLVRRTRTKC